LILVPTLYRILEDAKGLFGAGEDELRISQQGKENWAEERA
jgi:hypothetical protein